LARINIEDSIYKDARFFSLLMKLGDPDRAIGALVRAWSVAQEWFLSPEKMVPSAEWEKQKLRPEIIEVGFAERVDGKIRMSGADEQFAWLRQRSESGKRGGLKTQAKSPSDRQATAKRAQASSSSSSSSSSSISDSNSKTKTAPKAKSLGADDSINPVSLTWAAYRDAYRDRHGSPPPWNAKNAGQLAHFVRRIPAEEAPQVAEFFVLHNASRYVSAMHPVGMLLQDAEKLRTEWFTGRKMTPGLARQHEQHDANVSVVREFLEEQKQGKWQTKSSS
jgi:hypothetical protein